jgi:hypothetical protein
MKTIVARALILATAVVALSVSTLAQEGYPLTGTWYGEYGTGGAKKDITIVMKWDGSKASGLMNPGPSAVPLKNIVLDIIPGKAGNRSLNNPEGTEAVAPVFNVKIEVGDLVFEGKMQNPVGGNRSVVGTYTRGAEKGPFTIKHL